MNTGSSSAAPTFTIKNTGTGRLTVGSITLTGADLVQFSVTQPLSSSLAANASTTFTVTFSPTSTGAKNAVVNIASDDADENPFEINVGGTGTVPKIYGISNGFGTPANNQIYEINPASGTISNAQQVTLSGFTITNSQALAAHPTTGVLYGVVQTSGPTTRRLVTIDPATGVATQVMIDSSFLPKNKNRS